MVRALPMFGFPIFIDRIDPKLYKKDFIKTQIENNFNKSSLRNKWDKLSNIHHSLCDDNNSEYESLDFDSLLPLYDNSIQNLISKIKFKNNTQCFYKFYVVNYTCTSKDQFMTEHDHVENFPPNKNVFAAVHFLKFDDSHSSTNFVNSLPFIRYTNHLLPQSFLQKIDENDSSNSWLFHKFNLDISEDDIIFFPSLLIHNIDYQATDNLRMSVSLNIILE